MSHSISHAVQSRELAEVANLKQDRHARRDREQTPSADTVRHGRGSPRTSQRTCYKLRCCYHSCKATPPQRTFPRVTRSRSYKALGHRVVAHPPSIQRLVTDGPNHACNHPKGLLGEVAHRHQWVIRARDDRACDNDPIQTFSDWIACCNGAALVAKGAYCPRSSRVARTRPYGFHRTKIRWQPVLSGQQLAV